MTQYHFKNIDAVMAEKTRLKSQIAKKEEQISSSYSRAKAFYTDKSNWFGIIKAIIFRNTLLSNPISKFTLGFKIAQYLIKWFKR